MKNRDIKTKEKIDIWIITFILVLISELNFAELEKDLDDYLGSFEGNLRMVC